MRRVVILFVLSAIAFGFRPGPKPGLPEVIWQDRPDTPIELSAFVFERGDSMEIRQLIRWQSAEDETISIFAPYSGINRIEISCAEYAPLENNRFVLNGGNVLLEIEGTVATEYAVSRGMTSWEKQNLFSLRCPLRWTAGDRISQADLTNVFLLVELSEFEPMQTPDSIATDICGKNCYTFHTPDILFSGERLEKKPKGHQ